MVIEKGCNRLNGMYDHCDSVRVACYDEVPRPNFSQHNAFLNEVINSLINQGRNVYISKTSIGFYESSIKVPAIRERRANIPFGLEKLIRGRVLYKLGDVFLKIDDSQVREVLLKADEKYPHQYIVRMPLGTPLG